MRRMMLIACVILDSPANILWWNGFGESISVLSRKRWCCTRLASNWCGTSDKPRREKGKGAGRRVSVAEHNGNGEVSATTSPRLIDEA